MERFEPLTRPPTTFIYSIYNEKQQQQLAAAVQWYYNNQLVLIVVSSSRVLQVVAVFNCKKYSKKINNECGTDYYYGVYYY